MRRTVSTISASMSRLAGSGDMSPIALRATMIFDARETPGGSRTATLTRS
jgi:hypothetical protein